MRDLVLLAVQLFVTLAKFVRPGGVRAVLAGSLPLKHQLIINRRSIRRAPPLTALDRLVLGLMTQFAPAKLARYPWERHCRAPFAIPVVA